MPYKMEVLGTLRREKDGVKRREKEEDIKWRAAGGFLRGIFDNFWFVFLRVWKRRRIIYNLPIE